MGKAARRRFKEQQRGKKQRPATERQPTPYKETVRENALFEDYYQKQSIVDDGEWEEFLKSVREPLPAAFRVTGSKNQAEQLLNHIESDYFSQLNTEASQVVSNDVVDITKSSENDPKQGEVAHIADNQSPEDSNDTKECMEKEITEAKVTPEVIKPPTCLAWYPDGLAWQLEYSRVSIRQNNTLKKLHNFLVSESESGNISRQEAVSMIPPLLMGIKSHHKVLDMCAAPGSKTAQIIEYLHADSADPMPDGFVVGNDVDNKRCYLMVHQVKRLQSPNFMIVNHDATRLPGMTITNQETGKVEPLLFDRILCDVPCSGDGTLRKNPEVWRSWGPGHAINLHSVQNRVLSRGLELLAVGGRLVYSTCSFNPIENEAVIADMINRSQGAVHLVDCSKDLPELKRKNGLKTWQVLTKKGDWFSSFEEVPENKRSWVRPSMFPAANMDDINIDRCIRIVPHHQNTGGFFVAVLEKVKSLPWQGASIKVESASPEVSKDAAESPATAEAESSPRAPAAKKVKYTGFREDPCYYLQKDDSQWPSIKKFYEFDDRFDCTQFMVRSNESEKKRNIYLSSKAIRNVWLNNEHRIKYINSGVKVLARSEHVMCDCSYRLVQDGISCVNQYVHGRRITIQKADVIELLTQENPFFSRLLPATHAVIQNIDMGGLVMLYIHKDNETDDGTQILMTGWRGKTSCRVYVPKFERHHILRLCGVDPDKALVDAEWAIKGKTGPEHPEKMCIDAEDLTLPGSDERCEDSEQETSDNVEARNGEEEKETELASEDKSAAMVKNT